MKFLITDAILKDGNINRCNTGSDNDNSGNRKKNSYDSKNYNNKLPVSDIL